MMIKFAIVLFLIAFPFKAFAVTEFTVTVNKTGEDYASVSLAEAALDNVVTLTDGTVKCGSWDNQVGSDIADNTAVTWDGGSSTGTLIHMTNDNGSSAGDQYLIDVTGGTLADNDTVSDGTNTFDVAGAPDSCILTIELWNDDGVLTNNVIFGGVTTDSTHYWKLTSPIGERHNGTESSGAEITSSTMTIDIQDQYTVVEWLIIRSTGNDALNTGIGSDNSTIQNNIVAETGSGSTNDCFTVLRPNLKFYNNICYDAAGACFVWTSGASNALLYNNTCYNCGTGNAREAYFGSSDPSSGNEVTAINCIAVDSGTAGDFDTGLHSDSNYNLSSDASAPGANSKTSATEEPDPSGSTEFVSTTAGNEDLHLKSGAYSIDAGTDLSGSFTNDIDNTTRSGTWDIGADEFVSAAARRVITIH